MAGGRCGFHAPRYQFLFLLALWLPRFGGLLLARIGIEFIWKKKVWKAKEVTGGLGWVGLGWASLAWSGLGWAVPGWVGCAGLFGLAGW